MDDNYIWKMFLRVAGIFVVGCLTLFGVILVCYVVYKPIHRYQMRADASNKVKVTQRLVQVERQQIAVQKKHAQVEQQIGRGQKLQNEEIAKRLTPLFVQYSMIQALQQIATSGSNNVVVYIPSGAAGVPLVSTTNKPQVFGGESVGGK